MKITLQNTTRVVRVGFPELSGEIECRVWEGETESGIRVQALIPRIAAHKGENLSQFEAELKEQRQPTFETQAFPLRMVL